MAVIAAVSAVALAVVDQMPGPEDPFLEPTPAASSTATGPQPPSGATGPSVALHGNGGEFLSTAYEEGVREFEIEGHRTAMVGASTDGDVVAIIIDQEVRGIDAASSQTLWRFPSYACSEGSWEGVALCVDDDERGYRRSGQAPDLVGLDLATGDVAFRLATDGQPENMHFIGSDDARAYFALMIGIRERPFETHHVLAVGVDGAVAWMTALDSEEWIYHAALAAGDHVVLEYEDTVTLLDRDTGAVALSRSVDEEDGLALMGILWDGWLALDVDGADEKAYKVFDQSGTLVAEHVLVDEYVPSARTARSMAVPVLERDSLTRGGRILYEKWAVTREGERVVGEVMGRIVDTHGNTLAINTRLAGVSADGSLFLSETNGRSIHDARSGRRIGGFSSHAETGDPGMLEGIVYQQTYEDGRSSIVLLLPGSG